MDITTSEESVEMEQKETGQRTEVQQTKTSQTAPADPPQSPSDNTDGLKSWFNKKKKHDSGGSGKPSSTSEDFPDRSQVAPSGTLASNMGDGPPQYEYNFKHKHRGTAHIFVNQIFDHRTGQNFRKGAQQDEILYQDSFRRLGFQTELHTDYSRAEILTVIQTFADGNHWDDDAVVFAFSTHGDQGVLKQREDMPPGLAADIIYGCDGYLSVSMITSLLTDKRCPSMVNKPRLFFFQACRGDQLAETLQLSDDRVELTSDLKRINFHTLPVEVPLYKDFFMAFSTPPGYYSFRRSSGERCGSWFVLALSDVIKERAGSDIDLLEVVTALNQRMIQPEFKSNMKKNPTFHGRMIVPWVASMLTKTVRFIVKSA